MSIMGRTWNYSTLDVNQMLFLKVGTPKNCFVIGNMMINHCIMGSIWLGVKQLTSKTHCSVSDMNYEAMWRGLWTGPKRTPHQQGLECKTPVLRSAEPVIVLSLTHLTLPPMRIV